MSACLINGEPGAAIEADDRGLAYGDGLFETIAWREGAARFLDLHWLRLTESSVRLGLPIPPLDRLAAEIKSLAGATAEGTVKVIWTRGAGPRGYAPPRQPSPSRIVTFAPLEATNATVGEYSLRLLAAPASTHAGLAGIKSLNRLDNVLARAELATRGGDEGIMLDAHGALVGGTMSNLFVMVAGTLMTPDLVAAGVRGIMRSAVLREARLLGLPAVETTLAASTLGRADAAFVTNALIGIRPVSAIDDRRVASAAHPQVRAIMAAMLRRGVRECREF